MFMSTPHQGGNGMQFAKLLLNAAMVHKTTNTQLLEYLKRDSEWLQQHLRQYGPISRKLMTKFAYEEYKTPMAQGHSIMVVPKACAVVPGAADTEQILIHADHRNMVKFDSKEDNDYKKVSDHLIMMVEEAGSPIDFQKKAIIRVTRRLIDDIEAAIKDWPLVQAQLWMAQVDSIFTEESCIACPTTVSSNFCNMIDLALVFLKGTCFGCAQIFAAVHSILLDANSDDMYYYFSEVQTRPISEGGIRIQPGISIFGCEDPDYELIRIGKEAVTSNDTRLQSDIMAKHMAGVALRGSTDFPLLKKERIARSLSLTWLRQRLDTCVRDHPSCQPRDGLRLPTRILDLGRDSSHIFLVESAGIEVFRYTCLSYRWGPVEKSLRTLSTNYKKHKAGILIDSLCPMFQDVVNVIRQLQVRYLWIDALCIIQDSSEDWVRESAKMSDVYANAFLTIAASAYTGDINRGLMQVETEHYGWLLPSRADEVVICRREIDHTLFTTQGVRFPQEDAQLMYDLPLLGRGWVYQERALSPRYVHFGQEIVWECNSCTECECSWSCDYEKRWKLANRSSPESSNSMVDEWHRRVSAYTGLQLTFPGDIFPAIGGMARDFQRSFDGLGNFQAGMWENTILYNLAWLGRYRSPRKRVPHWRAPTWSWAALEGPVEFWLDESDRPLCEVIAVDCKPSGEDPFGALEEASITLEGFLVSVKIEWNDPDVVTYEPYLYLDSEKLGYALWDCWPDPVTATNIPPYSQVSLFMLSQYWVAQTRVSHFFLLLKEIRDGVYERYGFVIFDEREVEIIKAHWEKRRVTIV
ncbi:HET-domain-containing protein [Aaosphaeria arxii CBS 175.79]|uniref:HET-domain-containing protein n=1 Tax=Aaosphaeria arxii CBS 175.79 TaxID=1450172 RepID=A0A6A5XF55_9PLEO|nr:HET-domain-containing protein [Aaosphaeria arxii CBS 175.79]KAF2011499.1 HET-domain-containing protein [Aaosphaeria arxii CBS 175.79]